VQAGQQRDVRGKVRIRSKCSQRQEFVIDGHLPSEKTGRVGSGFSGKVADDPNKKLDALKAANSPLDASLAKGWPG